MESSYNDHILQMLKAQEDQNEKLLNASPAYPTFAQMVLSEGLKAAAGWKEKSEKKKAAIEEEKKLQEKEAKLEQRRKEDYSNTLQKNQFVELWKRGGTIPPEVAKSLGLEDLSRITLPPYPKKDSTMRYITSGKPIKNDDDKYVLAMADRDWKAVVAQNKLDYDAWKAANAKGGILRVGGSETMPKLPEYRDWIKANYPSLSKSAGTKYGFVVEVDANGNPIMPSKSVQQAQPVVLDYN